MKKWIVLIMALIFALGVTSMAFAADEKKPGVPGLGPEEKGQIADTQKKATVKKGEVKKGPGPVSALKKKARWPTPRRRPPLKRRPLKRVLLPVSAPKKKPNGKRPRKREPSRRWKRRREAAPRCRGKEVAFAYRSTQKRAGPKGPALFYCQTYGRKCRHRPSGTLNSYPGSRFSTRVTTSSNP